MLVIDNFQWIDRGSVDLLNRLLADVNGSLGLVTLSKNETTPLYCSPNQVIALKPLNEQQSARLVENMIGFGIPPISPRVVQLIARSGRGNANELCQMLVELASEMNETNFSLLFEQRVAEASDKATEKKPHVSRLVTLKQIGKRICKSIRQRVIRSALFSR